MKFCGIGQPLGTLDLNVCMFFVRSRPEGVVHMVVESSSKSSCVSPGARYNLYICGESDVIKR